MIEDTFRKQYEKLCVEPLLKVQSLHRVHPIFLTCMACLAGVAIAPVLAFGFSLSAFFLLLFSGFLDTLDGSLARHLQLSSSKGAALDIVCDRIVESAIVLGLYMVEPSSRALPALLMLGSILICVTSFLIVGIFTEKVSEKSFFYSPGLIERAEAFIFFAVMILFPTLYTPLAYIFSFLVFLTAAIRMYQFLLAR